MNAIMKIFKNIANIFQNLDLTTKSHWKQFQSPSLNWDEPIPVQFWVR